MVIIFDANEENTYINLIVELLVVVEDFASFSWVHCVYDLEASVSLLVNSVLERLFIEVLEGAGR